MVLVSGPGSGVERIATEHACATFIRPARNAMCAVDLGLYSQVRDICCGLPFATCTRIATDHAGAYVFSSRAGRVLPHS